MWYNSGMEISSWITLAAVVVALGIGLSSLIQTQRLQKRERKERLLNEIIEWATSIFDATSEVEIKQESPKESEIRNLGMYLFRLEAINSRSEYMKGIASASVFGEGIHSAVEKSADSLDIARKHIRLKVTGKDTKETWTEFKEYAEKNGTIRDCLQNLIKEAARIKTRDIS